MAPSPSQSAVEASRQVRAVIGHLRRRLRAATAGTDITLGQESVLARLSSQDGMTVSELAAAEGMRHQSMTTTVTPLLDLGLLQRWPAPEDGRRRRLALTTEGRRRIEDGRQARTEWLAGQLQDHCTEKERQTVIAAMSILERLDHD